MSWEVGSSYKIKYNVKKNVTGWIFFMNTMEEYTPGTAGGPGRRDRTLAVKSKKIAKKSAFFRKKI